MDQQADGRLAIAGSLLCLATGLLGSLFSAALAVTLLGAAGAWKLWHDRQGHHSGSLR
jgi:hypothetical protein